MSKQKSSKKSSNKKPSAAVRKQKPGDNLPEFLYNKLFVCLGIMALSFLLYANTIGHEYTQDDAIVIYDNMYTTQGVEGIPDLFRYDTFKGFFKVEGKANLVSGGRYRPLTPMMFALEWQLFKGVKKDKDGKVEKDSKGNVVYQATIAGHLINILFYGVAGVVLYLLLLQLLEPRYGRDFAYFVALVCTLLFVVHPIHTEAVANIKGRDEIITLLGSLSAAYFCIRAYQKESMGPALLAGILFFLALLSKENAITFLAIIPFMFWYFTKASWLNVVAYCAPLLVATILFLSIRFRILGMDFGDESMELMNNPFLKIVDGKWVPFSFGERLATIFYTLGMYIKLLIFPHPLTHDYYPRQVGIMSWSNWQSILSLLLYVGMGIYAIIGLRKKDIISFGIIYFVATLSIVSNLFFPVGTNMSERFMFMPSVGFCLIVAVLIYRWVYQNEDNKSKKTGSNMLGVAMAAIGIVALLFGTKTFLRNKVWKNNFTLFTSDIETSGNSAKLLNAVGAEISIRANKNPNEAEKNKKLREALGYLNKAIEIHPTYKNSYLQLGNVNNYLKDFDKAIQYYEQVLRFDANDKNGKNNLGITYREGGKYYGEQGNVQKAIQYLTKARDLRGDEYEVIRLLGVASGISGNHTKAIEYFTLATQIEPNNADAFWNLGNAYYYIQDQGNADQFRNKALQMDPEVANRQAQRRQGN